MGKLKTFWQQRPAKLRAICNLVAIALCLVLIYFFLGSPAFSVTDAFRRAEKASFLDKAEILARIRTEGLPYSHMILAKQNNGAVIYTYKHRNNEATKLIYTEKSGSLVLLAAPGTEDLAIARFAKIPLVLFDSTPEAVTAQVELTLSGVYKEEPCQNTYLLTAQREYESLFLFTLEVNQHQPLRGEGYLLTMLQCLYSSPTPALAGVSISANVTFFDEAGTPIHSQTLHLCPN